MIDVPDTLRSLRTVPLFALELAVQGVQNVGGDAGASVVGVIGGGRFEGERLRGRVLEGGSDWQKALADGTTLLDCRLVLETDDDALLGLTYTGVRAGPREVFARLQAGAPVGTDEYYLRICARFQTKAPRYDWLNRVVVVGVGQRLPAGPVYNLFEVL